MLPDVKQVVPVGLFGNVGVITRLRTTVGVGQAMLDAVMVELAAVAAALAIVVLPFKGLFVQPAGVPNVHCTGMELMPLAPVSDSVAEPGFATQVLLKAKPVRLRFTLNIVVTGPQPTPAAALLTVSITLPAPPSTVTVGVVEVGLVIVQFGLSVVQAYVQPAGLLAVFTEKLILVWLAATQIGVAGANKVCGEGIFFTIVSEEMELGLHCPNCTLMGVVGMALT